MIIFVSLMITVLILLGLWLFNCLSIISFIAGFFCAGIFFAIEEMIEAEDDIDDDPEEW